mmetsp:Transcript_28074/g.27086  ORF Transcript_28074/g.27086 Transcript_28074/m.27086 type:complete len:84 (+) Transcript_28074:82-333(+)
MVEKIRHNEINVAREEIKKLEGNALHVVKILYDYNKDDIDQNIQVAHEIANEYKSGKLDPKMAIRFERVQKEMVKKGKRIIPG